MEKPIPEKLTDFLFLLFMVIKHKINFKNTIHKILRYHFFFCFFFVFGFWVFWSTLFFFFLSVTSVVSETTPSPTTSTSPLHKIWHQTLELLLNQLLAYLITRANLKTLLLFLPNPPLHSLQHLPPALSAARHVIQSVMKSS